MKRIRFSTLFCTLFLLLNCSKDPSNFIYKSSDLASPPQLVIVLLHGLGGEKENFKEMQRSLRQQLPTGVRWLALEEPRTAEDAINTQAASVFKQLQENNVDRHTPIMFVGHSQGGLKAYWMAEKYGKLLNIKGVITIGTPWESTPLLTDNVKNILLNSLPHLPLAERTKQQLLVWMRTGQAGIEDMKLGSYFLQTVEKSLKKNQVPICVVAGKTSVPQSMQPFVGPLYGLFFGTEDHDLLVTVDSQLAKNIDVNAATFQRSTPVANVAHFPFDSVPFSLDDPQVIQQVETFIISKSDAV